MDGNGGGWEGGIKIKIKIKKKTAEGDYGLTVSVWLSWND